MYLAFHSPSVRLSVRPSVFPPWLWPQSFPPPLRMLLCGVVSPLYFLPCPKKRHFFLTVENVKAESEVEPCGESGGLSETGCGPRVQADLGLGAAGGGGLPRPQPQNTTDPQGPYFLIRMPATMEPPRVSPVRWGRWEGCFHSRQPWPCPGVEGARALRASPKPCHYGFVRPYACDIFCC